MACSQPVSPYQALIIVVTLSANGVFIAFAGPVSESDFFNWEALICGPKDTPFVGPFG